MTTKSPMLMGDGLRRSATNFPQKVAARDRFREITYGELNARVNQLANGLLSLGIRKGDDVALLVGNRIEHLEILFATAKIGALAIPLDIKWKALELGSVLDFFKPRSLILQTDCLAAFEAARAAHDLSWIKPIVAAGLSYGGLLDDQSAAEPP
ncbi:MAG: class I adenylate-forming enzyme family protein, partial [Deltaproteobacteria bacterium]|nr:class I adenylate-forming enzyme family protein [Deltaproteobacteria bacterium]